MTSELIAILGVGVGLMSLGVVSLIALLKRSNRIGLSPEPPKDRPERIEPRLDRLQNHIADLERGRGRLESHIANLERGQGRLESRVADLEHGQGRLESRVADLEHGQARLEARVTASEQSQARLEGMLDGLREAIFDRATR